jgi:hypothetical protein
MGIIINAPDDATRTQLLLLAEIIKLVGQAGDIARLDIANQPPRTGVGRATWTRLPGVLAELEAIVAVYRQLGGPELPSSVVPFAVQNRGGTPSEHVVGESMSVLAQLTGFAENFVSQTDTLAMATVIGRTG